jgi:hypothetical protein
MEKEIPPTTSACPTFINSAAVHEAMIASLSRGTMTPENYSILLYIIGVERPHKLIEKGGFNKTTLNNLLAANGRSQGLFNTLDVNYEVGSSAPPRGRRTRVPKLEANAADNEPEDHTDPGIELPTIN